MDINKFIKEIQRGIYQKVDGFFDGNAMHIENMNFVELKKGLEELMKSFEDKYVIMSKKWKQAVTLECEFRDRETATMGILGNKDISDAEKLDKIKELIRKQPVNEY